jgi:hypothetical protein
MKLSNEQVIAIRNEYNTQSTLVSIYKRDYCDWFDTVDGFLSHYYRRLRELYANFRPLGHKSEPYLTDEMEEWQPCTLEELSEGEREC